MAWAQPEILLAYRSTNPVGLTEPNYPRAAWWVAATTGEISESPLQRWILDRPVVLYRGASGQVIALDDRCPHRWAPLSMGKVIGDDIACGYHGFRFGADGRCTLIPTQATIPAVTRVHSYPVIEAAPFVWIWTGELDEAPMAAPPAALDWAVDPGRVTAAGAMRVMCNFLALKENVLDLSHFAFVHEKTLAVADWTSPPDVERGSDTITYRQDFIAAPLPAHYGVATRIGCERMVNRHAWGSYVSPALQIAGVEIEDPDARGDTRATFSIRICHATTPIDARSCHYWWYFSQDYGHGPNASADLTARIGEAFLEDKAILEATESLVRRDARGSDYLNVSVACDRAGIESRRKVEQLTARESRIEPCA